ncbi:predicted protein [Naegleria gruberi]|uniref:Predicted protein n=1 Tax=Naegleria gruberi TaxID=5762 RepID=D2VQ76_NAEGR|nr:uncharacterized protein NAEGRDRAFT_51352 [Naegleria gruberi]EFC40997.1 predicted protein [Naegleria gruberi]|eukprot:XP_002673741.1 predicted protein [Naegleria gruberi strain NEG-M]
MRRTIISSISRISSSTRKSSSLTGSSSLNYHYNFTRLDARKEMFPEEAAIFEKIVLQRKAIKSFNSDKPVPMDVLNHILALTQRAPTGYNLQPWTAVVVSDPEKKKALHEAALSQPKILEAPITVVFAANLNALANQSKVISMNVQNGMMSENEAATMSRNTTALLKSDPTCIIQAAKFVVGSVWSLFKPMMVPPINMKAYVWKQTMMPVQTFMLAASSHGLDTCPMEGFDERRVRQVVGLPCNYSIPIIVSLGYASDHAINQRPQSLRLNPEDQFFDNTFGNQKKDIKSFNESILNKKNSQ